MTDKLRILVVLAGLAAVAFPVDPGIPPTQMVELWTTTATLLVVTPQGVLR